MEGSKCKDGRPPGVRGRRCKVTPRSGVRGQPIPGAPQTTQHARWCWQGLGQKGGRGAGSEKSWQRISESQSRPQRKLTRAFLACWVTGAGGERDSGSLGGPRSALARRGCGAKSPPPALRRTCVAAAALLLRRAGAGERSSPSRAAAAPPLPAPSTANFACKGWKESGPAASPRWGPFPFPWHFLLIPTLRVILVFPCATPVSDSFGSVFSLTRFSFSYKCRMEWLPKGLALFPKYWPRKLDYLYRWLIFKISNRQGLRNGLLPKGYMYAWVKFEALIRTVHLE